MTSQVLNASASQVSQGKVAGRVQGHAVRLEQSLTLRLDLEHATVPVGSAASRRAVKIAVSIED